MHSIKMQDTSNSLECNSSRHTSARSRNTSTYKHFPLTNTFHLQALPWRDRRARRRTTSGARVLSCLPAFWISSLRDSDEARGRLWWCCPSYTRLFPLSRTFVVWSRSLAASGWPSAFLAFWACSTFSCPLSYRSRTSSMSSTMSKKSWSAVERKSLPFDGPSSTFLCSKSLVYWIPACLKRENCLHLRSRQ